MWKHDLSRKLDGKIVRGVHDERGESCERGGDLCRWRIYTIASALRPQGRSTKVQKKHTVQVSKISDADATYGIVLFHYTLRSEFPLLQIIQAGCLAAQKRSARDNVLMLLARFSCGPLDFLLDFFQRSPALHIKLKRDTFVLGPPLSGCSLPPQNIRFTLFDFSPKHLCVCDDVPRTDFNLRHARLRTLNVGVGRLRA